MSTGYRAHNVSERVAENCLCRHAAVPEPRTMRVILPDRSAGGDEERHFYIRPPQPRSILSCMSSPEPRWMKSDLILWFVLAIASGILALICAVLAIENAQNIPWANSVGGVNPFSLGSALTAAIGVLVFGLISSTCTVVCVVVSHTGRESTSAEPSLQGASER